MTRLSPGYGEGTVEDLSTCVTEGDQRDRIQRGEGQIGGSTMTV